MLHPVFVWLYSVTLSMLSWAIHKFFADSWKGKPAHIGLRLKGPDAVADFRQRYVVWVHGASLGEMKVIKKFLELFEKKYPENYYVVTATSDSAVNWLKGYSHPKIVAHGYFPLDTLACTQRVLKRFNIRQIWLAETEIWPALIFNAQKANIAVHLFNGRVEAKTVRRYRMAAPLFKPLFQGLAQVLAQSTSYAERFERLGVPKEKIRSAGNLKQWVQLQRPESSLWQSSREQFGLHDEMVFSCGCVHPEETAELSVAIAHLQAEFANLKTIIVPRHIEKTPDIVAGLQRELTVSDKLPVEKKWDILLLRAYGVLDQVYMISDFAFIGGSFSSEVGGHNPYDAARWGIPVFIGPYRYSQLDSCESLSNAGVGFFTSSGKHLAQSISEVITKQPQKFIQAYNAFQTKHQMAFSDYFGPDSDE